MLFNCKLTLYRTTIKNKTTALVCKRRVWFTQNKNTYGLNKSNIKQWS